MKRHNVEPDRKQAGYLRLEWRLTQRGTILARRQTQDRRNIARIRDDRFDDWLRALEARHLADLTFPEVSRALRALSSTYVERRRRLIEGGALSGAGKRAAFALFYGPIHYLLVHQIVHALPGATATAATLVDLGCGSGVSGVAWARACDPAPPRIIGIDRPPWVLREAMWTYRTFGLVARTQQSHAMTSMLPKSPASILAAFLMNELGDPARDTLLRRLMGRAAGGDRVLIIEPLAGSVARWWKAWRNVFVAAGGRADEWRFRVELPPIVAKLDRAAGLDHRELTGRSLWLAGTGLTA